jgi:hypothetical protein
MMDKSLSKNKFGLSCLNLKELLPDKTKYRLNIPTEKRKGLLCCGKHETIKAVNPHTTMA